MKRCSFFPGRLRLPPAAVLAAVLAALLLLTALPAAAAAPAATACPAGAVGPGRDVEAIRASGVIMIGVYRAKPPFGYTDAQGEYQGYDVYYARRLAQDLGVVPCFVPVDPATRVEMLDSGRTDVILANFTVTPERAELVDFCLPYMKVALGVVSPRSSPVRTIEDLRGRTMITIRGTRAEKYFDWNYPEIHQLRFDTHAMAYAALQAGLGHAFANDNKEVLAWALSHRGFVVGIDTLGDIDTIAPAVRKGNRSLRGWINHHLRELGHEQFFHKAYKLTLAPVYGSATDAESIVIEGGVVRM